MDDLKYSWQDLGLGQYPQQFLYLQWTKSDRFVELSTPEGQCPRKRKKIEYRNQKESLRKRGMSEGGLIKGKPKLALRGWK